MKLIERMLHPATPQPEAENSAQKLARVLRADGVSATAFASLMAAQYRLLPPPVIPDTEPAACDVELWFGKHRGQTLREVAETNLPYLRWLVREHDDENLVNAAQVVIDWFTSGGGE